MMDKDLFEDLVQSLKEAKAITKGEIQPSRRFTVEAPDVRALREKTGLSQTEFAGMMRVSVKTLQNWEQHRRKPTGPAAVLLHLVNIQPEILSRALNK